MESIEKMLKIIIATHQNPAPVVQNLYNDAAIWEKPKIKEVALKFGIKLNDENQ